MTLSFGSSRGLAPSTIRETFELFAFFRPEFGVEGLIANLPLEGMTPRQVYYAAHGRPPDSIATAVLQPGITAADVYAAALKSEEFRENFVARFLEAFREKRRLLFVHVPKCAGSDLSSHLICRFPSLNTQILDPEWASTEDFFAAIRDIVLETNISESIYVHGHNPLSFYKSWDLIRFQDEIFTILRDPIARVISQINYVLTRIFSDEIPVTPDTRGWRDEFGIRDDKLQEAAAAIHEISHLCLHDSGVVVPNIICEYLGKGTHDSAVEQTVINDLEITDTNRYDIWSQTRWNMGQSTRRNASKNYVNLSDFSESDREYIKEICSEDLKFYDLLIRRLEQNQALSIKGSAILPGGAAFAIAAPDAGDAEPAAGPPAEISADATRGFAEQAPAVAIYSGSATTAPQPEVERTASASPNLDPLPPVAAAPSAALLEPVGQAVAVESEPSLAEAELPLGELMMRFESLGENCEFGLVQRRCGAEPLGLFRFASAPLPKLLAGLEAGFEGLSDADNLDVQLSSNGREYMVYDKRFQLLYHAWVSAAEMSASEVHQRETRRLPLLIRKLIEDLREAEKIFIFHGMEPLGEEEARRLLALLRGYGPNTLLWIEVADAEHPPGTVAWIGEGLLKAYIDRFAPGENAHDLSLDCWIAICREAYRLWRIGAGGDRTRSIPVPESAAAQ
jgi:Sulfotransferase family